MSNPPEAHHTDDPGGVDQGLAQYLDHLRRSARPGDDPAKALGPLQQRISAMTQAFAELQTGTYEGSVDDDDRVVAVVDGRGKLLRMQISPYAMRGLAAGELGRACTDAIAAARAAAATAMSDALKRLTGIDPDTAEAPNDLWQVWKQGGRATRWSP